MRGPAWGKRAWLPERVCRILVWTNAEVKGEQADTCDASRYAAAWGTVE